VTFCNPNSHDSGEYVRSVFNNFVFVDKAGENKSAKLKEAFYNFIEDIAMDLGTNLLSDWPG
jgi:hypothetical protein